MEPRPFWNPYVAGVALGLVLLGSFLLLGFGLGASGAANRLSIGAAELVAPGAIETSAYFSRYAGPGMNVLDDFMVFEVLGVFLGGLIGAYSAGRIRRGITMGPSQGVSPAARIGLAVLGGVFMGVAARLARGCTSGQALTGGSLLSVGSWVFMMAVFVGGYLTAPLVRRQWR
ncbi:MAG: YeeE/YedE family protein [Deltaproteobacteria bacterium]|nr:YeeE/YedE family protein [Deltaproteobacteria bacterium]